jgi:hypothetical protein
LDVIEKLFTWGVPLLVLFLFWRTRQAHDDLKDVFRQLATETGGKLSRAGDIRYPILTVEHRGRRFSLTNGLAPGGKVWVTKLHTEFHPEQPLKLRIQPTDRLEEFSKKLGFQDVKLGHPEFDRRYLVKTGDPDLARDLISRDLQKLLVELRPLRPELWLEGGSLAISTQMQETLEGYRPLVKLGRRLCEIETGSVSVTRS